MAVLKQHRWIVVVLGLILSGCGATKHNYLIKRDLSSGNVVKKAMLEIRIDGESFISVSALRNPGERAALATSVTSAYQATPPPQGASPGGMAAAFFLTTYVAKATADSAMVSESDKKARQLIDVMTRKGNQAKIEDSLTRHFLSLKSMRITAAEGDTEACCDGSVIVSPQVLFSNDLRRLEIKVDYLVAKKGVEGPIYSNSFVYQPDAVAKEGGMDYWTQDEASLFFSLLDTAFSEIVKLIDYEFAYVKNDKENPKVSTIKYSCNDRTFFERGTLLWSTDQRVVIRDLRGNVRSFRGKVL